MPAPSIVPTSFHPAFVGGALLGSGLNSSLLRKIQLVQFWLDQQYAGVTFELVQGSPSGSSSSGGTHEGPGDAGDVKLVDFLGRSPATMVWVAASAMFRLLDCLSYVRGNDVNADGIKDDTFAPHIHVIDREGTGKVAAALAQISQFLAHQNGLVGGHPDLEATVTNPLTLATYTDAEFTLRYQALTTSGGLSLDAHIQPAPQEDDDMPKLIKHITHDSAGQVTGQATYVLDPLSGIAPVTGDEAFNIRIFNTPEVFNDGEINGVVQTWAAVVARNQAALAKAVGQIDIDEAAIAKAVVDEFAHRIGG